MVFNLPLGKTVSFKLMAKKIIQEQFPIVGIGASAGGLEALEQFFANMPPNNGIAFVIIQHLDPTHPGIMPQLLQRITGMHVQQARDRCRVKPGFVYVIPPKKSLSILNGVLHLMEPVEPRGLRLPIDVFFRSLAEDRQDKSIGIILSGMGSDGSLGIKAIKEKHGMVMVQDPANAKFDSMPKNALQSVTADIVANAADLPARLINLYKNLPQAGFENENEIRIRSNIEKIIILLRENMGHDFSLYKKNTLIRRVDRRKAIHQLDKIQDYVRYLQENPAEVEILFNELLIGVTNFFRDTAVWNELKESILPQLITRYPEGYVFRAWVPACSTGEEAYSLAIIFHETLESLKKSRNYSLQIFATDIDHYAVDKARKGKFPVNITSDVSPERIGRFFTPDGEGFRVKNYIREMIVFATQNVIKDPPFTKLDIISCRNMLIYMEQELQKRLLYLFHYSTNPGGILILGNSESQGNLRDIFSEREGKHKIFQRLGNVEPLKLNNFSRILNMPQIMPPLKNTPAKTVDNTQTVIDHIMLQRFSPPGVLVSENGDIIYITGRTGKYLEPVAGKANWNIFAMAREGLKQELPGVFRRAMQHYDEINVHNIKVEANGSMQRVDLKVQRLESPELVRGMIIVIFKSEGTFPEIEETDNNAKKPVDKKQRKLEAELKHSLEELQITREEMQTSQEELKSTNEEIQSTNEELQSTNEELTTSKEEMQSLNEELQTVNIELQSKINDLMQANSDMKNLLNSTEIATLFLDKALNVKRFTETVTRLFKLRATDIGRPFTEVVTDLQYTDIEDDAMKVLNSLVTIEKSITTMDDKWFSIRIMPYRTIDDRIDGLVITFSDITQYKLMEMQLKEINKNATQ